MHRTGLTVAGGIKGLDTVIGECFLRTQFQRCVTHPKRNVYAKVRSEDKAAIAVESRGIFRI